MIEFQKIEFKNIGTFGNYPTVIDFTEAPTTLVVGANGAGKSFALLDTLTFALYGTAFRNINKNQIVNSINGEGCLVKLWFQIGAVQYQIIRGISPTVFELYKNGVLLPQDAKSLDYQKKFEENVLHLDQKSFTQLVVLGSASYVPFMELKSTDRRAILEDLLDIRIFSQMHELLKQNATSTKVEVNSVEQRIVTCKEKIELQKSHIEQLKQNRGKLLDDNNAEIEKQSVLALEYMEQAEELKKELSEILHSISDRNAVTNDLKEATQLTTELKERTSRIQKSKNFFVKETNCPTCEQAISGDIKTKKVSEFDNQLAEILSDQAGIVDELNKLKNRQSEIELKAKSISLLQSRISEKQSGISAIEQYITKLEKENKVLLLDAGDLEAGKVRLAQFETELLEFEYKKDGLIEDKYCQEVATGLLKDSGLRAKLIAHYIPIINQNINKYLREMELDVQFEINPNFQELIKSRGREQFCYSSFSEGEKTRISTALLLSLREIAVTRNAISTNILILDEYLDGSSDSTGTEIILRLLQKLSKTTHIFIISHKGESLLDKFDRILMFEKRRDFSYLSQVQT